MTRRLAASSRLANFARLANFPTLALAVLLPFLGDQARAQDVRDNGTLASTVHPRSRPSALARKPAEIATSNPGDEMSGVAQIVNRSLIGPSGQYAVASGFLLGTGDCLVATAAHLLSKTAYREFYEALTINKNADIAATFGQGSSQMSVSLRYHFGGDNFTPGNREGAPHGDYVLLQMSKSDCNKLKGSKFEPFTILDASLDDLMTNVDLDGTPFSDKIVLAGFPALGGLGDRVSIIRYPKIVARDSHGNWVMNAATGHGYSGGPAALYIVDGGKVKKFVLGIIVGGDTDPETGKQRTFVSPLRGFAKRYGRASSQGN